MIGVAERFHHDSAVRRFFVIWTCVLLSVILWMADSIFVYFWVNAGARSFLSIFTSLNHPHILILRLLSCGILAVSGFAVGRLWESLLIERRNSAKYQTLIDTSSDWLWEVNQEGVYTFSSQQVETLLGYKPEEILGKTPFDLMPPEEAERVADIFKELVRKGETIVTLENVCLHKEGHRIVLETSGVPIFDGLGTLTGYRGVDHDITKRKQTEKALRESEEKHRRLVENLGQKYFFYSHDTDGIFSYLSSSITQMLGYTQEEFKSHISPTYHDR